MDPIYGVILFGAIFMLFIVIIGVVRARRMKEKAYYMSAVLGFLMFLSFICILLNQFILFLVPFVFAFILSILWSSKIREAMWRETAKQLEETDVLAPLKVRDFLEWKGWIKLAGRWGVWKTTCLYSLVMTGGCVAMFFTLRDRKSVV